MGKRKGGIYGTGAKGKATRLHSEIIRSAGRCEICGSLERLQAAHIISRNYDATRTDLRNALVLCAGCHMGQSFFSPVEVSLCWLNKYSKRLYNELVKRAKSKHNKIDWDQEVVFLSSILERIKNGEQIDFNEIYD